ncbi:MAG: DUF1559 domain-containing protein [Isosphaeraceae bacterium]
MTIHRPRGLTLAELLVIIAIMISLILPLIVRGHINSRRMHCANNMRMVGLGLIQYLNTKRSFPNAGTFGERSEALPGPGRDSFDLRESFIYQSLKDPARFPPGRNAGMERVYPGRAAV